MADIFQQLLGPRPSLTLDIEQGFVTGIWVAGRRPDLIIRDFDLGASAADASPLRPHTCFHSEELLHVTA
ncbi:MAG TPA: hypothetical protein PKY73_18750 [Hyphomonas sp.]|nr:hypothetical protein [Hyphomonas sp.]